MPYTVIGGIGEMELGEHSSSENKANILTLNNVLMFAGDIVLQDYTAGEIIATVSDDAMKPALDIVVPVYLLDDATFSIAPLIFNTDGELQIPFDYENATLYLSGIVISLNNKYYTPEIGNIFNNGTSPLSEL